MVYSIRASIFCLAICFFLASLVPGYNFFSPALVMCMYNGPLALLLWLSLGCGAIQDCMLLSPRFGFFAISFVLTAKLLYPIRLYFFKDALSTLPIMTFLFSSLSSLIALLVGLFLECGLPVHLVADVIVQPFYEALSAFGLFVLLPIVISQYRRIWVKRKS